MNTHQLPREIESRLALLETQFETVVAAVTSGDPVQLESAGEVIRQAAMDFSGMLQNLPADVQSFRLVQPRLKKIANALAAQRVNLIRRTAVVERTLNALVPSSADSTYKPGITGPYASAVKQSGAFKVLAA